MNIRKMKTIIPLPYSHDFPNDTPEKQVFLGIDNDNELWRGIFAETQLGRQTVKGIAWTRLYSWEA